MMLLSRIACVIDGCNERMGRIVSWLILLLVLVVSYDVAMRYLFRSGSVALQELEWHIFACAFLFGAAYTLKHNDHVRVDVLYQSRWMNDRRRAMVDLFGTLFFLLPFCAMIVFTSWPFVISAYEIVEGSPDPGGLPYRYLLKAAIPVGFIFLALQGIAMICHSLITLRTQAKPTD